MTSTLRLPAKIHGRSPIVIAVAGLLALSVAVGIGRFAFTPILPMMQADAGLSIAAGGWLASANYLGYFLGSLSIVILRVRAATAIRAGLVVIAAATIAMGFEHRLAAWIVLRTLAGIASAWVLINVSAWCLGRLAPFARPVLDSTVFAGVGTGTALAGAVCLVLMRTQASSAEAWVSLGLVALVVTGAVWRAFGDRDDVAEAGSPRATGGAYRWDADSVRLVLCYGAFGFGYIIPATFLPVMARRAIQDPAIFGWSWPVFGAAAALSTLVVAGLSKVIGNRRLWGAFQLVQAFGVAIPVAWPGIGGIIAAALAVGGTFMILTMLGMQEGRQVGGPRATRLMAAMTSAFALGQIVGPVCVSYLVKPDGDFSAVLLVAAAALALSACALLAGRTPAPRSVS